MSGGRGGAAGDYTKSITPSSTDPLVGKIDWVKERRKVMAVLNTLLCHSDPSIRQNAETVASSAGSAVRTDVRELRARVKEIQALTGESYQPKQGSQVGLVREDDQEGGEENKRVRFELKEYR